ncbi:MAG: hypothetical protein IPN71_01350 [Fibrobacteres bacterium]|nr:hypothetical protein [Fibrobacterota bacterium]
MNRPNPFGPHHHRDDREPMLMDISTAKPSGEINWDAIVAKTQQGKVAPGQKAYDTSKYLSQVREQDPWPAEAPAKSFPMILSNCRIREAAPVDLSGTVTVLCDVESAGPIAEVDRTLKLELRVIYRESTKDSDEPAGKPEFVTLQPVAFQTVQATFSVEGLADSRMDQAPSCSCTRRRSTPKRISPLAPSRWPPSRAPRALLGCDCRGGCSITTNAFCFPAHCPPCARSSRSTRSAPPAPS